MLFTGVSFYTHRERPLFAISRSRYWRGQQPEYYTSYQYDYNQQAPLYAPPQHNLMCPHHPYGCFCHTGYAPLTAASYSGPAYRGIFQPVPPYPNYGEYSMNAQDATASVHSMKNALYCTYTGKRLSPPPKYSAFPVAQRSPRSVSVLTARRPDAAKPDTRLAQDHSTGGSIVIPPGAHSGWRQTAPSAREKTQNSVRSSPPGAPPPSPVERAPPRSLSSVPSSVMSCPPALPTQLPDASSPPGIRQQGVLIKDRSATADAPENSSPGRAANLSSPSATMSQLSPPPDKQWKGSPLSRLLRLSYSDPGVNPGSPRSHRHGAHREKRHHQFSAARLPPIQEERGRATSRSPSVKRSPSAQRSPLQQTSCRSPSQPRHPSPPQMTPPQAPPPPPSTPPPTPVMATRPHHQGRRAVSEPAHSPPVVITAPRQTQSLSDYPTKPPTRAPNPPEEHRWASPALDGPALRAKIVRRLESKLSVRGGSSGWSARANSDFSGPGNKLDPFERRDHFSIPCSSDVCEA